MSIAICEHLCICITGIHCEVQAWIFPLVCGRS
jgi:hypothetical protein